MSRSALIVGGSGQIGWASAEHLREHGWEVTVASRGGAAGPPGVAAIPLDREDTEHLHLEAEGHDLVVDAVAFTPAHAAQWAPLAGRLGSLVVISTASVYVGRNGTFLDVVTGDDDFPVFDGEVDEADPVVASDAPSYSALKAAMERELLAVDGLPVSILRPQAIHGPRSVAPREWFFVKRALDRRPHTVLAYEGLSRFGTTATAVIAELARLCGDNPGRRVLNAADPNPPVVSEIGATIFAALGHDGTLVRMPGPPVDDLGASPWAVPHPFVLSMRRAEEELGYVAPGDYATLVRPAVDWLVDAVDAGHRDWRTVFPRLVDRYGADTWFDYAAEDAYVASRG